MKQIIHFFIKYLFRTLHLASFAFILGNLAIDYGFGKRINTMELSQKQLYIKLHIFSSIIIIVSGLINLALLVVESKFKKDIHLQIWKSILFIKLFITLALTPILEKVLPNYPDKELNCQQIRLVLVTASFLVSPFLRYYREKCLTKTLDNKETKLE